MVHAGAGSDAVREVAVRTGIPADDLEPVDAGELLEPGVLPQRARPCDDGPVSADALRARLDGGVAAYDDGRIPDALGQAAATWDALACLATPLSPDLGWRIGFLAGVASWAGGDEVGARDWWTRGRAFDPARGWDHDYAPRGALDAFAIALPPPPRVPLATVGGAFTVDGAPAGPTVAAGWRLLQAGARSWLVEVDGRPVVAIHPAVTPADVVSWPASPERGADLATLLAASLPGEGMVYVVGAAGVYRVGPAGAMPVPQPAPPPQRRRVRMEHVLLATGGTVVGVAGVSTALAWSAARSAAADGEVAVDPAAWDDARSRWEGARGRLLGGYVAAGAGGALLVSGAVVWAL